MKLNMGNKDRFKFHTVVLAIIIICSISSCKKNDSIEVPTNPIDTISSKKVMILGSTGDSLVLWVNDTMQLLNKNYWGQSSAKSGQIIAVDTNIYIAGWENDKALYYKNGVKTIVHQQYSAATCIGVSNNEVIVGGFSMDNNGNNLGETYWTFWKNGIRNTFYDRNTIINALLIDGNDRYFVGNKVIGGVYSPYAPLVYLKNNTPISLSIEPSEATDIAKNGNDIYIVGNEFYNNGTAARIWKNNVGSYVENSANTPNTSANAVFLKNSDVYVAGTIFGQPAYWKNGTVTVLDPNVGKAIDIYVTDSDIYVIGQKYNVFSRNLVAAVWKNGVGKELNGMNASSAFSIIIK